MDALLLHALAERRQWNSLRHAVPQGMLAPDTLGMFAWYGAYFQAFPERTAIDVDELASLVRLRSGNATPEQIHLTLHLVEQLRKKPDDTAMRGILGQLQDLDMSGRAAALIEKYQRGEEVDITYELSRLSQAALRAKSSSTPDDYIDTPINELLGEVSDDKGLKFRRVMALREHILGLQGGASVAIAARPDKGKTSFIASVLTDFAPQVVEMHGNTRPILWLNNEGSGKRIIPRIYQAALGKDLNEIIAMSNVNQLVPAYTAAIGGIPDLIRVKDMHGASLAQIDQVIESMQPAVVVGDMLGNFRLGGAVQGSNKADAVEQIWQEWREMMVRHDCIGLATVQISVEGGNMLYPPYSALKDSKTGVQGATDVIIMMGSLDNADAQTIRGLSSPKNKFAVPGKPSCFQSEVYFDGARCVFNDGVTT
ncbi:MAG TPA: AAA family ATPase [Candidatus Acidoferrum sp.]|nr:AAA family ATPase [Candidatus Acidoferrum sp.]